MKTRKANKNSGDQEKAAGNWAKLGDVARFEFGTRITRGANAETQYPVYGGGGESFRTDIYNRENDYVISRFAMSPNCVRFVKGKFFLLDSGLTLSVAPEFAGRVSKHFIGFFLLSIQHQIYRISRGQAQKNLDSERFRKIEIPMPPLSEQRQIVARLRQELQNCDKICRVAKSQFENARAFPAVLLRDIFQQVNHFPMVVLSDLCDVLRGVAFSANQSHNFSFAGSVACATTKSVREEVDWESCRHIPAGVVKNHARILQVGDILISIANSKELVGKISVIRAIPFRATFGAFVAVLRSNKGVLPEFLALYLRAPQVKRYFYIHSSNTTNISNLNMRRVMAMPVALPSLAEQRRLVNYSRAQLKNGTDILVAAEKRLESARALPQAILRRAFS